MPTINISGAPPGGPYTPSATGPSSEVSWMNPARRAAFEAWEAQQRSQSGVTDYDRALKQKAQQERQDALQQHRARVQVEAMERQRQAALDRQTRAEIRQREQQISEQRRASDQQRIYQRQEAQHFNRAFDRRTADRYRLMRREADEENRLRDRLDPNTYRRQNINRLGFMGQRAADQRDWRELYKIERDLSRIEKISLEQLKVQKGAGAASAQRNLDVIREARQRIAAGRAGTSGIRQAVGGAGAAMGMLMDNPLVGLGIAAVLGTAMAPQIVAGSERMLMGLSRPYTDLVRGTMRVGRAGGFDSSTLLGSIYTGAVPPAWMAELGITSPQQALGILGNYGIATTSAAQSMGVMQDVQRAYFENNMGLSSERLAQMAGRARQMGMIPGGFVAAGDTNYSVNLAPFFNQMQKVMTVATRDGLDHAQVASTIEKMLQQTAGAGGMPNIGRAADFWHRLEATGNASMRTGVGQIRLSQALGGAASSMGFGGPVTLNNAVMGYFNTAGWPKSEDALRKSLGMTPDEWAKMDAGNKETVKQYLTAIKSGDKMSAITAFGALSNMNAGTKAAFLNDLVRSPVIQALPMQQRAIALRNLVPGASLTDINTALAANVGGVGKVNYDFGQKAYDYFRKQGYSDAQARGIASTLMAESGGNIGAINPTSGAYGIAQWLGSRVGDFQRVEGVPLRGSSREQQLDFVNWELNNTESAAGFALRSAQTPEQAANAMIYGYERPSPAGAVSDSQRAAAIRGRMKNYIVNRGNYDTTIQPGETGAEYTARINRNKPVEFYKAQGTTEAASVNAAQQAFDGLAKDIGGPVGTAINTFATDITKATTALNNFIASLVSGRSVVRRQEINRSKDTGYDPGIGLIIPGMPGVALRQP